MLELLGEVSIRAVSSVLGPSGLGGRAARPVATTRVKAAARNSTSAKSPSAMPRSTSSTIRRSSSGPGGSATPATTRATWCVGAPGVELARPPRPGRRTPTSAAGRAATALRPASPTATRTTARRGSRAPRCRRGGARGRRSPASVAVVGTADQQGGRAVGRLAHQHRVGAALDRLEEAGAGGGRPVVPLACRPTTRTAGHEPAALRRRWSLTGCAVPSCWAKSDTRYSSSSQRTSRSPAPGGRPARQRRDLVEVGLLEREHLVHQLPVVGHVAGRPPPAARAGPRPPPGSAGSAAAGRARPRRRSRRAPAGRPAP